MILETKNKRRHFVWNAFGDIRYIFSSDAFNVKCMVSFCKPGKSDTRQVPTLNVTPRAKKRKEKY